MGLEQGQTASESGAMTHVARDDLRAAEALEIVSSGTAKALRQGGPVSGERRDGLHGRGYSALDWLSDDTTEVILIFEGSAGKPLNARVRGARSGPLVGQLRLFARTSGQPLPNQADLPNNPTVRYPVPWYCTVPGYLIIIL